MRLFFTAALIGCGAFHVAFGQNTCETFTDHIGFNTTGMATGPTSTLETITVTATMTFSDTYASSDQGNGLGPCASGNPPIFRESATGASNSKGLCNPIMLSAGAPISGMYQNASMQVETATINSNGVCSFSSPDGREIFTEGSWGPIAASWLSYGEVSKSHPCCSGISRSDQRTVVSKALLLIRTAKDK